jgi:hypothetical protein
MDMMKMGFIPPEEGLKLMDMGGVQKLYATLKVDESQAQRENIKMKRLDPAQVQQNIVQQQMLAMQGDPSMMDSETGEPSAPSSVIPVNDWDNHAVHVAIHNNFRKSQAFEMLDDSIKQEFQTHVNTHMAAINDAMEQVQGATGINPQDDSGENSPGGLPSNENVPPTGGLDNAGIAPPDMEGMSANG